MLWFIAFVEIFGERRSYGKGTVLEFKYSSQAVSTQPLAAQEGSNSWSNWSHTVKWHLIMQLHHQRFTVSFLEHQLPSSTPFKWLFATSKTTFTFVTFVHTVRQLKQLHQTFWNKQELLSERQIQSKTDWEVQRLSNARKCTKKPKHVTQIFKVPV